MSLCTFVSISCMFLFPRYFRCHSYGEFEMNLYKIMKVSYHEQKFKIILTSGFPSTSRINKVQPIAGVLNAANA